MKARGSLHLGAVVFVILLGAAGCAKAPNDAQIASDIQSKINADSGLQGKQLGVQATNGSVTLSGSVDNDAQRDAAARYAASVPGVKQVVNNLTVGPAPATVAETTTPPPPAPRKRREPRKPKESADSSSMNNPTQMADQTPPPAPAPPPAIILTPPQTTPAAPATPPPPPPPQKVTIPSGTALTVRLVDSIDSEKNQVGDTFQATLNSPLTINGDVVVPSGSTVQGHLANVKSAGKFAGQSVVVLQLDSITSGGNTYNIQTDQYTKQGSSRGKNTAEKVGAGAGIGAIIGAIAGGGKGAAIGAAAGGGLGGGVQAATKGQQIKLPSETVLNFTLQNSVTVVATSQGPNAGRPRLDANQ
jgi:BON domain